MTWITEAAEKGLSGSTGFAAPEALSVRDDGGLFLVVVRVTEPAPAGPGLPRSYEVAVDAAGEMHGYRPVPPQGQGTNGF